MVRSYKYRLYPTGDQKLHLEHHFGCCRMVWNLALTVKKTAWQSASININRFELQRQLIELKKEYDWLCNVNAQSLLAVLLNLDKAYRNFFNGFGYPRFKRKSGRQSFQCPQGVKIQNGQIVIPRVRGIKTSQSYVFVGKIKTVTIFKTPSGKFYASVLVDSENCNKLKSEVKERSTTGVDIGIKSFAVTSGGRSFKPNQHLKNNLKRLQCLQKRSARKKKGSKNRKKSYIAVALLYEKITNQRVDYIHKITTELIRDNQVDTFVIEDLNVAGMVKNRKLSRVISDASFGEFSRQMKYKCDWYGKNLIVIDRFAPSSKRCSNCGMINDNLTLDNREWTCECGAMHDRDLNAAKNIKYYGLLKHSGEGISGEPVESRRLRRAKKQEKIVNNC